MMLPIADNTHRETSRVSIGIVCPSAYPLFDAQSNAPIGGMESRAALYGRLLANNGVKVSFYLDRLPAAQPGIPTNLSLRQFTPFWFPLITQVQPRFRKRKWFPIINGHLDEIALLWRIPLHLLHSAYPRLLRSRFFSRDRTDAVMVFGNNTVSARAIEDCRRLGIPVILMLASDLDVAEEYANNPDGINPYGDTFATCRTALHRAALVIAQSVQQQKLLKQHFNRTCLVIQNPAPLAPPEPTPPPKREYFLWIGRADPYHKRPKLFFELARRCPEISFLAIVNPAHATHMQELENTRPPNLKILHRVAPDAIWHYFRQARGLVNTSSAEGFPNTFLQAGQTGTPVISLSIDPDGLLTQHQAGFIAHGNVERLVSIVKNLWANPDWGIEPTKNLMREIDRHHNPERSAQRLLTALLTLVGRT